ncbi:helix-turn-helix domain-containing protein [Pseudescherichia vulneris]
MTTLAESQATRELIDVLTPYVVFEDVPPRTKLYLSIDGMNMCYILQSGLVKVGRETDDFVMSSLPTPNIFGITNRIPDASGLFLETLSVAKIATLKTERAHEIIAERNAWKLLVGHITKITTNLFKNNAIMTAPTSYDVLKFQLLALMREPDNLRQSTTAAKYILERTRLSRSTVMKMLSQLKVGGYIEIDDGMLKAVHRLPEKY